MRAVMRRQRGRLADSDDALALHSDCAIFDHTSL